MILCILRSSYYEVISFIMFNISLPCNYSKCLKGINITDVHPCFKIFVISDDLPLATLSTKFADLTPNTAYVVHIYTRLDDRDIGEFKLEGKTGMLKLL